MPRATDLLGYKRLFLAWLLLVNAAHAAVPVTVLDFELKDLTLVPGTQAELARTASIAPLLRKALEQEYSYEIISVPAQAQEAAEVAVGYLFDHADVAAALCVRHGADWIVAGRLHKPSFLFAYIQAHLIDCNTKAAAGDFTVEVKGDANRVTEKGVAKLAMKINQTIQAQ